MTTDPELIEVRFKNSPYEYVEEWYCTPPDIDVPYRVLEDEWVDGQDNISDPLTAPIRRIRRIELEHSQERT